MKLSRPAWPSREEFLEDLRTIRRRLGRWVRSLAAATRREYGGLDLVEIARRLRREVFGNPLAGRALYGLTVTAWAAFIVWGRFLVPLATAPYFRPETRFQVIGFFENGTGPQFVDSWPTFQRYADLFDVVSPFWYSVDSSGKIVGDGYRPEVVNLARSRGIRVIPLVTNLKQSSGNGFDAIRTASARAKTVENLSNLVAARDYDGLNLGYELLPPEARESYSAFVTALGGALRGQGRTLLVSVFPDVEVSPAVSGFFDYRAIGRAADGIILLVYDLHYSATDPGPVAPLPWAEAGVDSLLGYVSPGKVILGVGSYAYDWPTASENGIAEYLSAATALARAQAEGVPVHLDPASRQSFFTYVSATGIKREVWLQNAQHLADKAALARAKGLSGLAVWRLGFSEDGALDLLAETLGRRIDRAGP